MPTIYIDGTPHRVGDGLNLLEACLSLGFNVPYFCWHPALGSVGACRQCAVKAFQNEQDKRGRIVMACMTSASEGTRISLDDPEVKSFRAGVIEWLMTNHPHDCPVCDEGGECHLQDMTVMCGHNYRDCRFPKRTYRNQNLGPFINHEMNRCIQCYRCVRYYRDYAGGRDFDAQGVNSRVYFGRHADGPLASEFSGNLVEVCPTGVFTDKTQKRHFTRRWDLQTAPSICVHCGAGCNITPGERYGTLRRIRNRYNGEVNGYFLCDRGRYGYEFVNGGHRARVVMHRDEQGSLAPTAKAQALSNLGALLAEGARVVGIGSPRASLESNYALRGLVGPDNFFTGMPAAQQHLSELTIELLMRGPARTPSMREMALSDAVLVLGEDLTNTAPRIALALRQSVLNGPIKSVAAMGIPDWNDGALRVALQDQKGPFFIAAPDATKLDDIATETFRAAPEDIARLGFAVAHIVDPKAPEVPGLPEETRQLAERIAARLAAAQRPLVVSGSSLGSESILSAAAAVASALSMGTRRAGLSLMVPECNTVGAALLGGGTLEEASQALVEAGPAVLIILENDLYRRTDRAFVDNMLAAPRQVILIDHTLHETAAKAEYFLSAATFAEGDGTLVNSEGRGQRCIQVFMPTGDVQESWRWVIDLGIAAGKWTQGQWRNIDAIVADMAAYFPVLQGVRDAAPLASFRIAGFKIPRQSHRYSGRTAMRAKQNVSEPGIPTDPDSPLTFSMEGFAGPAPSSLASFFWAPGWNSVQSINKFQEEIGGALMGGDPGVRLITPELEPGMAEYPHAVPEPCAPHLGQFLVVPMHHIYGSDEMSMLSPAVAERAPAPYVALSPEDAREIGLSEGEVAEFRLNGQSRTLPVAVRAALPKGVAGIPVGLPGVEPIELPAWGVIARRVQA
jgi:NADH-quinone oxidoreductase subunit G